MRGLDIHHVLGLAPPTTLAGPREQRLVPHASGMSRRECDQAQLTHLRADVGLPPTGPAGPPAPAKSQLIIVPRGGVLGLVGQRERKVNHDPEELRDWGS